MNKLVSHLMITSIVFSWLAFDTAAQNVDEIPEVTSVSKHKDWAVQCTETESRPSCFMYQRILVKDSGDILLRMTVDLPQDLPDPRAIFLIPLGAYVAPGISVQIDSNEPVEIEIEYCDKQGCYGGILLGDRLLAALKNGQKAVVTFQTRARQKVQLPISLTGFTSGFGALN